MSASFDLLWDQVSTGKNPENTSSLPKTSSFDDLWSQVEQTQPKKKSLLEKGGRVAAQYGIGALQGTPLGLAYEIGTAPLSLKGGQETLGNIFTQDILSDVYPTEAGEIPGPRHREEYAEPLNIGLRDIVEKVSGIDLQPENIAEKAANWMGWLKGGKVIKELSKSSLMPKDVIKAISPSGTDVLRGLGAGTALQMAEQGELGPIATMAAAVVGDLAGGGAAGLVKGAKELVTKPKETLAKVAASFTPKDKLNLQKEIIQDFRDAGIQADLGTTTDSNLIKWTQSRLAQSGLTGKALDDFRQELTGQIKNEYKALAEGLGEARYATNHEAGEAAKSWLKQIREKDLSETRKFYQEAEKSLKDRSFVDSRKLYAAIEKLENSLKPGQIKSVEQGTVLSTLEKLKRDIVDSEGNLLYGKVKDLMNNKIALNDIINYEVQGGAKQLLKTVVAEIDRAIISHGKENPSFAKNYINANKRFSEHAKTFRNKSAEQIFRAEDPAQILTKMNTVQGIKNIGNILNKSPGGKDVFNSLKRLKLDKTIGDNLVDSTTQQAKLGTFSKLLEKGKNAEVLKEILGPKEFKRLQNIQKNAGRLADAAQKFYNASKSGAVAVDAAVLAQGISAIAQLFMGNPWAMLKVTGSLIGAKKFSNLLADPEFLKLTENVILATEKKSEKALIEAVENLRPYILQIMQSNQALDE